MTENEETGSGVSQPLPPEVPVPRTEPESEPVAPIAMDGEDETPWWRAPAEPERTQTDPAAAPPAATAPAPPGSWAVAAGRSDGEPSTEAGEPQFWRGADGGTPGGEGVETAHVIGAHIGEAIASHLPNPEAAAAQRGLDIRWMRLKYVIPALAISLLLTWRGDTPLGHLAEALATGGIFRVLGWAMGLVLPLLILAVLPVRTLALSILSTVSTWVLQGVTWVFGRAWKAPVLGYLLRLVVAVVLCSTALLILKAVWRGLINILTGV